MKAIEPAEPPFEIINISKGGIVIARSVLWAGASAERTRGLLGRESIGEEEGIYIIPCQWVHTFGMKFPIDVAFLSKERRILAINHDLRPNRLSKLIFRAEGVLELKEGQLAKTATDKGDILQFREIIVEN